MQCLSEIKNKKILLIVAHPDDETLWFFQSIQKLKIENEILIFCLTHAAVSKRGKELSKVADKIGIKVVFGHCEDTGIDHLLKLTDLRQAFIKVFSKHKIDVAITHPPHGGEKPHPHHIQIYNMTKDFCAFYTVQFGFFSEQRLLERVTDKPNYHFSFKKKKYIAHRIFKGYQLLNNEELDSSYLLKCIFTVLFNFRSYRGFEIDVDLEEKQSVLANFESQQDVLKSYNAFYKKSEFLFLEIEQKYRSTPILDFFSHQRFRS